MTHPSPGSALPEGPDGLSATARVVVRAAVRRRLWEAPTRGRFIGHGAAGTSSPVDGPAPA